MALPHLTTAAYEERKIFLDELKTLVKSEQETIFVLLKRGGGDFSENSNGVFFDVAKIEPGLFSTMKEYMEFAKRNRANFSEREEEERKAAEIVSTANSLSF